MTAVPLLHPVDRRIQTKRETSLDQIRWLLCLKRPQDSTNKRFWSDETFLAKSYLAFVVVCIIVLALGSLRHAPRNWTVFGVSVREIGSVGYGALNRTYGWFRDALYACFNALLLLLSLFCVWLLGMRRPIPFLRAPRVQNLVRKPLSRIAFIPVLGYFAIAFFHRLMIALWWLTPLAAEYNAIRGEYSERCLVTVQNDQYGGSHVESDWSKAPALCHRLARRARSEYPKPPWFFGSAPDWNDGD